MKNPLFIEFTGVSGAGKTAVIRELVNDLEKLGLTTLSYLDFLELSKFKTHFYPIFFALVNFQTWRDVTAVTLYFLKKRPGGKHVVKLFLGTLRDCLIRNFMLKRKPFDVLIWENLYSQMLLVSGGNGHSGKEFLTIFFDKFIPQDTYLFFVFTDVETISERIIKDNLPSRQELFGLEKDNIILSLKKDEKKFRNSFKNLEGVKKINLFSIDGKDEPKKNAAFIKRVILQKDSRN